MDVMHERCAGLDVHKATIVACVRSIDGRQGEPRVPDVRYDDGGASGVVGLVDGIGLHSRGDGGDRSLLETGMEHPRATALSN